MRVILTLHTYYNHISAICSLHKVIVSLAVHLTGNTKKRKR